MAPATKQDVQALLDQTKNRITEKLALRQDVQYLQDLVKNLVTITQQTQQLLRQGEFQRAQLVRRSVALETRIVQLEQELKIMNQAVARLVNSKPEQIVIPAEPEENKRYGQYIYRPA